MNLAGSPHKLTQTENLLERMTYLCLRSRFQLGFCAPASCKHTKPSPALRSASVGGREIELRVCAGRELSVHLEGKVFINLADGSTSVGPWNHPHLPGATMAL